MILKTATIRRLLGIVGKNLKKLRKKMVILDKNEF